MRYTDNQRNLFLQATTFYMRIIILLITLSFYFNNVTANNYYVTVKADTGTGSITAAINSANLHAGPDSIILLLGINDTIHVRGVLPAIYDTLVISAGTGGNPTISGDSIYRQYALLHVSNRSPLTINYINMFNCISSGMDFNRGGAVFADSVFINNCFFCHNMAYCNNITGGVVNGGGAVLATFLAANNCTFYANRGFGTGEYPPPSIPGGALFFYIGQLSNCTFINNTGSSGGAVLAQKSATINNCTFYGNNADYSGSALEFGFNTGTATIANNIFYKNTSTQIDSAFIHVQAGNDSIVSGGCNFFQRSYTGYGVYLSTKDTIYDAGFNDDNFGTFGYHGGYVPTLPIICGNPAVKFATCPGVTPIGANGVIPSVIRDAGAYQSPVDTGLPVTVTPALSTICSSDSVWLCASAGFTHYAWSSGDSGWCIHAHGGVYNLLATYLNCSATATATVIVKSGDPVITTSSTDTKCIANTGTATVHLTGGTGPFTYLWYNGGNTTPGITNRPAGTYKVNVTNALGCTITTTIAIHYAGPDTFSITAGKTQKCADENVQLCAPAGYMSYFWNNQDTGRCININAPGDYYLSAYGTGCFDTSSHITISNYAGVTITYSGDTLTAHNGVSYIWMLDSVIIPGSTRPFIIPGQHGNYTVTATDINGCVSSFTYLVTNTNIAETGLQQQIEVYPNPVTDGQLHVAITPDIIGSVCQVYDLSGRVIYTAVLSGPVTDIKMPVALTVYLVRINTKQGIVFRKIVELN